jgi:hypothetical protein
LIRRSLRLELVAALGVALALPALALPVEPTGAQATQTSLAAEIHDQAGRTQVLLTIAVTGEDGLPATGAAVIEDAGKPLAGVVLDAHGHANSILSLLPGSHNLAARYTGDATHQSSLSQVSPVRALTSGTPDFGIAVAPATLTLTAGQSGSVVTSITPINSASLSAPMFVTLSCSGLPDQSACTFTPENIEILPNATTAITSTLVVATQSGSTAQGSNAARSGSNPVSWAILMPGTLGLMALAFGTRRRRWLSRLSLLAVVGLVGTLGTTACNPRYNYEHHGPPQNLPTPSGTYTLTVTAQSSNGITAITHSTTMVLTVN